jgi:hypothetical protein
MKLKIVSDGTNTGTHLIDEETGKSIEQISKLSWEANAKEFITTVSVELTNIPVEIISTAEVNLFEHVAPDWDAVHTKDFQEEIKIVSERNRGIGSVPFTKILDNKTGQAVGAIQEIKWECTPHKQGAVVKKIFFDKKDWV